MNNYENEILKTFNFCLSLDREVTLYLNKSFIHPDRKLNEFLEQMASQKNI